MKRRRRLKPSVKEWAEVFITGIVVGIVGFIIANIMSVRFHSEEVIEMQKKTEMYSTQISQK